MDNKKREFCLKYPNDPLFNTSEFDSFLRIYKEKGSCAIIDNCIIYTPHLACILLCRKIKGLNKFTKEEEVFNGQIFIKPYKNGYKKGIKYFHRTFPDIGRTIYDNTKETAIWQLHENYFHRGRNKNYGWNWIKDINNYPLLINEHQIFERGYYSGIVSALDDLIAKNNFIFEKYEFHKCWKDDNSISIKNIEKEKQEFKNEVREKIESSFTFMKNKDPRKHKQIINDEDFKQLISWVTDYYTNEFSIPNISTPIEEINTAKGNIIYAFKKLFKDLNPTSTYPESLFVLIKSCFKDYRDDNIENFKKLSEPKYFQDLINR